MRLWAEEEEECDRDPLHLRAGTLADHRGSKPGPGV
jgi:hypothetical protein